MADGDDQAEPNACENCGAPQTDGWVVMVGGPKEGARLTPDHCCVLCGAPFWHDDDEED